MGHRLPWPRDWGTWGLEGQEGTPGMGLGGLQSPAPCLLHMVLHCWLPAERRVWRLPSRGWFRVSLLSCTRERLVMGLPVGCRPMWE